jgi:hypothetical protein
MSSITGYLEKLLSDSRKNPRPNSGAVIIIWWFLIVAAIILLSRYRN